MNHRVFTFTCDVPNNEFFCEAPAVWTLDALSHHNGQSKKELHIANVFDVSSFSLRL